MKKLIVLLSGIVIAASAAAQTTPTTAQPAKAGTADRQAPVTGDADKRVNPAAEPEDSANSVSTDFQGSSKQESTAAGMGQPKKQTERTSSATRTGTTTQDVEDKTKK
ncbi:hypothetical protein AB2N08_20715 [Massilia aurea]|uniref:hypothetical protein n=1 Tax=Massilia aurea TaxID=373040 RepID=UPI003461D9C5